MRENLKAAMRDALQADELIDLDVSPIVDGAVVTRPHLPPWVDLAQVEVRRLGLHLSLACIITDPPNHQPVIPALSSAIDFSRAVVRYVTAGTEHVPHPYSSTRPPVYSQRGPSRTEPRITTSVVAGEMQERMRAILSREGGPVV